MNNFTFSYSILSVIYLEGTISRKNLNYMNEVILMIEAMVV